jgi:hypothetical protein
MLISISLLNIDDDHNFFIGKRFNTSEGSHPVILRKCYRLFAAYDIAKAASFTFICFNRLTELLQTLATIVTTPATIATSGAARAASRPATVSNS